MFVLLVTLLLAAITLGVMQLISADTTGGVRELQAVQAFNVAEAGMHYALGQLQASGSTSYAGETKTITSGSTTLGTATITVNCIDTGGAPPCSGTYAGYRRIISVGTLTVGGPSRTVVAIVQGTASGGGGGYGICGLSEVMAGGTVETDIADIVNLNTDIGANGTLNMTPGAGLVKALGDTGSPQKYKGKLSATGTISCGTGCSAAGGTFPGQSGTVCPAPALPTFTPGSAPLSVLNGATFLLDGSPGHGYSWSDVSVGVSSPTQTCPPYTTLQIQTSTTDPTATTVVELNSLYLAPSASCSALMILGVGKVELRIAASTGTSLDIEDNSLFGVDSTYTPVAANRLTVYVNSAGTWGWCQNTLTCAVWFTHAKGTGSIVVPNGLCQFDDLTSRVANSGGPFTGAVVCAQAWFTGDIDFYSDTSGLGGGSSYSNFNNLRSWKDQ